MTVHFWIIKRQIKKSKLYGLHRVAIEMYSKPKD